MSEVAVEDVLPVAVIGAGPQGLAAAAHLVERSVPVVVLALFAKLVVSHS